MYVSFLACDMGAQFVESCRKAYLTCQKQGVLVALQQFPVGSLTISALKKAFALLTSWTASSVGFAVGSYFNVSSGGIVGATLLDLLASQALQLVLTTWM